LSESELRDLFWIAGLLTGWAARTELCVHQAEIGGELPSAGRAGRI